MQCSYSKTTKSGIVRHYYSESQKVELVEQFSHSRQSLPQFSQKLSIHPSTFRKWVRKFGKEAYNPESLKLHRIEFTEQSCAGSKSLLSFKANGCSIDVLGCSDVSLLAELVHSLSAR